MSECGFVAQPVPARPIAAHVQRLVADVVSTPGTTLDPGTRSDLRLTLGHDFSRVRVHDDARAAAAADSLGALAFTTASHVVFGAGRFRPRSREGSALLSHELVHTVGAASLEPGRPFTVLAAEAETRAGMPRLGPNVIGRQTASGGSPAGGGGGPLPPKRIIYVDFAVFDQINRGNKPMADALLRLVASEDVRVTHWTYREMVVHPGRPHTVAANVELLKDLGIRVDEQLPMPQRVAAMLEATPKSGVTGLSAKDAQVAIGARAGGGEVWSTDKAFASNPKGIHARFGVTVSPESQIAVVPTGSNASYAVGRGLLGLEPVEISPTGVVKRGPRGPGGGGGPGGAGGGGAPGAGASGEAAKTTAPGGAAKTTAPGGAKAGAVTTGTAKAAPVKAPVAPVAVTPVSPASPKLLALRTGLVAQLEAETARVAGMVKRIQIYTKVAGSLFQALELLSTASDALAMAADGTVLGDAQRQANAVRAHAEEAEQAAQLSSDKVSLITATVLAGDAIDRRDTETLFDLSERLSTVGLGLKDEATHDGVLGRDLRGRADAARAVSQLYYKMAGVPQGVGTASNASQFAMATSLERLSGTMGSAADLYKAASEVLDFRADYLVGLAHKSNREAWDIVISDIVRHVKAAQGTAPVAPGP